MGSRKSRWILWSLAVLAIPVLLLGEGSRSAAREVWFSAVNPGPVTRGHARIADDCSACHESWSGADDQKCVLCHANDTDLLQRQSTSFHSYIDSCTTCHPQHLQEAGEPGGMDHEELAALGLQQVAHRDPKDLPREVHELLAWLDVAPDVLAENRRVTAEEAALDCYACHQNQDVHFGLMGQDCVACHETKTWSISAYRHPSPGSRDCAHCHQAPPSHYMGHFKMISAKVANKPHADVRQCFMCHQTSSWIDIKGVGLYKHH